MKEQSRPQLRLAMRALLVMLLVPIGLYFAAAGVLSHLPANAGWREPADGVTIYIESNGVHTGIVMPAVAAGIDWRARVRAADLPDPRAAGNWLAFGWGDLDFYLNTPTWSEVDAGTALGALIGSERTALHVAHYGEFVSDPATRPLRITVDQYRRLAAYIDATFAGGKVADGYGPRDVFYAARGRYSAIGTCNVWVGEALKAAGVRTGVWTPFAGSVMQWVPDRTGLPTTGNRAPPGLR